MSKKLFAIIEVTLAIIFILGCAVIGVGKDISSSGVIGLGIGMVIIGGIGCIVFPMST